MSTLFEKLSNYFTLSSPVVSYVGVWIAAAIIWLVVVACTLSSISTRAFRTPVKVFWAVIVVAVPLVGVLAYLPFSLSEGTFPYIGFWRKPRH